MSGVKIRLRSGSREIELEGPREDVDALLERWWSSADDSSANDDPSHREPRPRPNGRPSPAKPEHAAAPGHKSFDAQSLVNKMRNEDEYQLFEEKVLHSRDTLNKLKLVCWYSGAELTTGEMAKVLHALGVKIDQSQVSHALSRSRSEFLQDGVRKKGAIVRYKLAGKSGKDFEAWLRK